MAKIDDKRRNKNLRENDLIEKWMSQNHPTAIQWVRQRLGPIRDRDNARLLSVTQRYADIIYIDDGSLWIIEAKLKPSGSVVGQLLQYKDLIKTTPEFKAFWNYPIKMAILTPYLAIDVLEFAKKFDIEYFVWDIDPKAREIIKRKKERIIQAFQNQEIL